MAFKTPLSKERELELVRRYEADEPIANLCCEFGRSGEGIRRILLKHGTQRSRKPLFTQEQKLKAAALYRDGLSIHQVAKAIGFSDMAVHKALKKNGVQTRPNPHARLLSNQQSDQLALDYQAGGTHDSLEQKYGVSDSVIARVLREHGVQPRVGWAAYRNVKYTDRHGTLHSFKSTWEAAYAKWMDQNNFDWKYEPCRFELVECRQYTPDFGIYVGGAIEYFVEVKGWVTKAVERRMLEFRRVYPQIRVVLIGPAELAKLGMVEQKYLKHPQATRVQALREALADT